MAATSSPSVIVIDDEVAMCAALESLLSSNGVRVSSYGSAEEFLQAASPDGTSCLILDVNLPGMSGFDLLSHLAHGEWQRIPVIFITAHDDPHGRIRARALAAGAHAFFAKPLLCEALLDAVSSARRE